MEPPFKLTLAQTGSKIAKNLSIYDYFSEVMKGRVPFF
jgi:hypothetical protein